MEFFSHILAMLCCCSRGSRAEANTESALCRTSVMCPLENEEGATNKNGSQRDSSDMSSYDSAEEFDKLAEMLPQISGEN